MYTGPNILVEGLVFGYDTGYPQTTGSLLPQYRFNKGEPTENIRASTGLDSSYASSGRVIDNSGTLTAPNGTTGWSSITSVGDQNAGYRIAKFTYNNVTQDVEYTFSLELYNPGPNALEIFVDGNAGYSGTTIPLGHSIYSFTLTPPANRAQAIFFGTENKTNNVSYSPSRVILFKNYQVEAKSHATPFVNETRSVSGSLIDLTRTTDIDITNVSFDSNAQMSFDGTDDKINGNWPSAFNSDDNTTDRSWEVVLKTTSTGDQGVFGHKVGTGCSYYCNGGIFLKNGNITFNWYDNSNYQFLSGGSITTNKYIHVVGTFDGSDAKPRIYVNGELIATYGSATNLNYSGGMNIYDIGWNSKNGGQQYFSGEIPVVRYYKDKALSLNEVKQNFEGFRKRFNI